VRVLAGVVLYWFLAESAGSSPGAIMQIVLFVPLEGVRNDSLSLVRSLGRLVRAALVWGSPALLVWLANSVATKCSWPRGRARRFRAPARTAGNRGGRKLSALSSPYPFRCPVRAGCRWAPSDCGLLATRAPGLRSHSTATFHLHGVIVSSRLDI